MYLHRTCCDVIQEATKMVDNLSIYNQSRSKALLKSLLSEIQVFANRMEAGLYYHKDLEKLHSKRKALLEELESLQINIDIVKSNNKKSKNLKFPDDLESFLDENR